MAKNVCLHGSLQRQCPLCEIEADNVRLQNINETLLAALKEISESVDRNGEDSSPFYLQDIAEKALKEVGEL